MDSQLVKQAFGEGCSIQTLARLLDVDRVDVEASLREALAPPPVKKIDREQLMAQLVAAPLAEAVKSTVKRANGRPKAQFLPPVQGRIQDAEKPLDAYPPELRDSRSVTGRLVYDALAAGPADLAGIVERLEGKVEVEDIQHTVAQAIYRLAAKGLMVKDDSRPPIWSRK